MITIAFFKAFCWRCFRRVAVPLLGEFSYGELVLQTEDGTHFAHVALLDNPVFDAVCETVDLLPDSSPRIDPQRILARLADSINGQYLIARANHCPCCNRRLLNVLDNTQAGLREIPALTWNGFLQLSRKQQESAIEDAIRTIY